MHALTLLQILLIVWAGITAVLVLLLIYRSIIGMHEDDQLFLNDGDDVNASEQQATIHRITRVAPLIRAAGALSGVLILVIAGMWLYQGLAMRGM